MFWLPQRVLRMLRNHVRELAKQTCVSWLIN
jgi:hypothetical protein